MNIVTFEEVSKSYRMGEVDVAALDHVSLEIPQGAFSALVGPSGSGKTTALNLIGCLDRPSEGRVTVAGRAVGAMNLDRNLQPGDLEMYRKIINIEPDGKKKEFVLWFLKKDRDKVVTLFVSPASESGRATLRLGDNMWLYIPNVGKPIRITSMQSVVGGVFNNADIMRLDYGVEYDVADLSEDEGRYLLELKAKSGAVAYDRLQMWVLKEELVPTRIDCYASTGMLIKTLITATGTNHGRYRKNE